MTKTVLSLTLGISLACSFEISTAYMTGKTFYVVGIDECWALDNGETEGRCPYLIKTEVVSSAATESTKLEGYDSYIPAGYTLTCAYTVDPGPTFTNDCSDPFQDFDYHAMQTFKAYETAACASVHVEYTVQDLNDTQLWFFNEADAKAFYDEVKTDPMTPLTPELDVSTCPPTGQGVVVIPL